MKNNHVIWDWNGTLLDDFAITAQITADALAELGRPGVTPEMVREHYRRPLSEYFSALLGRTARPDELRHLGEAYERNYDPAMHGLPLAIDALDALSTLAERANQSLLSMAPHGQIEQLIEHHGLGSHFTLVEGFTGTGHPTKRESLERHCETLDVNPRACWLIGDTVDDFAAAAPLGVRTALVTTGMQGRDALLATGAPVFDNLADTAEHILNA